MKKLTLLFAALVLSFTAQATIINGTPNPGEKGRLNWWVNGVVDSSTPVTQPGDTIVLADGEYEEGSIKFEKEGLVVMAAEGAKPVIKASSYMQHYATTTFIGITFDGQNTAEYATYSYENTAKDLKFVNCEFMNYTQYTISASSSAHVDSLIFENCVLDGSQSTLYAIYAKGTTNKIRVTGTEIKDYKEHGIKLSDAACVDALIVTNSLIHDCAYTAIQIPAAADGKEKQSCSSFELTNSTIYNIGDNTKDYGAIDIRDNANIASTQQVLIDHVTLYNFTTKDWYGGFMIYKSANATISNCIASNPDNIYTTYCNPFHAYVGATINNCIYYNAHISSESTATYTNCEEADPMFVDAANADFMLYAESPAVGMGDPRWGVKAGLQPGNGILSDAVAAAQSGDTIVLGDGEYIEKWSFALDKEGLVVMAAEGAKPVIKASSYMQHKATTTFIGITFDGQNTAEYATYSYENTAKDLKFVNCEFMNYTQYTISASSSAHVDSLIFENCVLDGSQSTLYAIYAKGTTNKIRVTGTEIKDYKEHGIKLSDAACVDALIVTNSLIHDCAYTAIQIPAAADGKEKQSCSSFELTNSTIYNIGDNTKDYGAIDIRDNANIASTQQVLIDHVTLYNFTTKDWYGGFMIYQSANATISNCIVSNPADLSGNNGYHVYGNAIVTNSLYHNCNITSGAQQTANIKADPLFVDAANANFMLSANSPALGKGTDGSNLGDPRWGVSASLKGKVINIEPGEQTLAAAVGYSVSPGDTIVLADGTYEEPYSVNFDVEGLVVMAAEGAKPVIANASEWACLELSASTTFDGITFDAGNVAHYIIASKGAASGKFAFVNCEFKGWTTWAISNQYEAGTHVDSVIVDNCLFHDGLGGAISFSGSAPENQQSCQYFKMTNTTLYNLTESSYRGIINVGSNPEEEGKYNEVVIDHITMYNYELIESGIAAIAVRKSTDLKITNSIIANPEDKGYTALNVYGGTVDNTIHYNGSKRSGNTVYTKCENIDPLFVDAANNDFMLQANSPAIGKATDGTNLGDPRWGVAEPELITLTTGNNDAVIEANIGKTVNVKIERSFTANDGYYTLCVPFNMDPSVIGKAYSLGTITEHVAGEGINIILVEEEYMLSAGVPYLVLPKANMSELVVENVTIQSDIASGQNVTNKEETVKIFFEGFYSAPGRTTNGTTEYYVGNDGYLYKGEVEIRGLCGLFTITDENGDPLKVRARVVTREEVETGLDNNQLPNTNIQKVLENGQLIIIRDGVKYNVQGQVIK